MAQSFVPVAASNHMRVNPYTVNTGATIAVGDPVELNSSGLLICGTATSAALVGVAAEACTSAAAGTKIGVYDDPKQIYKGRCDNVAELLQAVKGDTFDIVGSTGAFFVNLGATAVNVVRVVRIGQEEDALLTGAFPFNTGDEVFFEIALHEFNS